MPGKYDQNSVAATFISAWLKYRSGIVAADDPAHPEAVVPIFILDLSKSFHGIDSEIRVFVKRTAGTGTVDVTLFLASNGDLVTAQGYYQAAQQTGMATGTQQAFTALVAGIYVIELTNLTSGAHWDVYVASNYGPMGSVTGLVDGTKIAGPPIQTPIDKAPDADLTAKVPTITT